MPEASRMSSGAQSREHRCVSQQRSGRRRASEELCGGEESRTGGWGSCVLHRLPRARSLPLCRSPCVAQHRSVPRPCRGGADTWVCLALIRL